MDSENLLLQGRGERFGTFDIHIGEVIPGRGYWLVLVMGVGAYA
jgi:hypothetical protein